MVRGATRVVELNVEDLKADEALASVRAMKAEADVRMGRAAIGVKIRITVEGFPDASCEGNVAEVPDSIVTRRVGPEDPGRPVDDP